MGPNGSGKSTLSHVLMGRDDYEVTAGLGHDRRRRAARPAHLAARRSSACSSRCSTRSRCPACRSARCSARRWPGGAASPTDVRRRGATRSRRASACPPSSSPAGSTTSSPAASRSARRPCSSRCSSPQFALLDEIDSGLDVDALRDVARRVVALTARGRARRARDHALRPAAHRAAPRPRARAHGRPHRDAAAGPSSPTSSRRPATRASPPGSASRSCAVASPEPDDPFADPGF